MSARAMISALVLSGSALFGSLGCTSSSNAPTPEAVIQPIAKPTPEPSSADLVTIGERKTMTSAVMGEERPYWIHLPRDYAENSQSYPVIYLLDGDWHFHHASGLVDFLSQQGRMPPAIIVGIPNTNRTRDLTPTAVGSRPGTGGADKFLSFIETELVPAIERDYRTAPFRILVGHSLGGLFAVHSLISRPGLFNAHIGASPALPWDGQLMARNLTPLLKNGTITSGFLYYSLGTEPVDITEGNKAFAELLTSIAPEGLRWKFDLMAKEDHSSVVHRTIYRGLEMLFEGWAPPNTITTVAELKAHYAQISTRFKIENQIPEELVNVLGYRHMQSSPPNFAAAKGFFEFNVSLYPDSANVYDSLGEAHEKVGEFAAAFQSYENAVAKSDPKGPNHALFIQNRDRAKGLLGDAKLP